MCQPGIMKQVMDGSSRFRIGLDNFKPSRGWINHSEIKQRVCLSGAFVHDIGGNNQDKGTVCQQ